MEVVLVRDLSFVIFLTCELFWHLLQMILLGNLLGLLFFFELRGLFLSVLIFVFVCVDAGFRFGLHFQYFCFALLCILESCAQAGSC